MRTYTAVIERCPDTGLYVGYVPGFAGAHSQARTLDELNQNLREVIGMLFEDAHPASDTHFVGIQNVETVSRCPSWTIARVGTVGKRRIRMVRSWGRFGRAL